VKFELILEFKIEQKHGTTLVNSFQAIAPLTAHGKGVNVLGIIFPSKMGLFAPFLATIQALSRTRAFLSS
jgi:hypothetical protein